MVVDGGKWKGIIVRSSERLYSELNDIACTCIYLVGGGGPGERPRGGP